MRKRRVLGVYAPPARPTPTVVVLCLALATAVIVALGLAIDPYLAPIFIAR